MICQRTPRRCKLVGMKRTFKPWWPGLLIGVLATCVYGEEIPADLKPLLADLSAENFETREAAAKKLDQAPSATTALLEHIQKEATDPELKQRLSVILQARAKRELLENLKKDMTVLPSGLGIKTITAGTGESPKPEDSVVVHYKGLLIDGKEFDSSYSRKEPATFPLTAVIKGWTEGLQQMKAGGKYMLLIPPELAYGANGAGPIPANATLIFQIELLEVRKSK